MDQAPEAEFQAIDASLMGALGAYRARYLEFFLRRFEADGRAEHRGGWFNINSVTGCPYEHGFCYSWTDGRSLGELVASEVAGLEVGERLRRYADHLLLALLERYRLNGYFPHVVDDSTNLAAEHPMNVALEPGQSSFSHIFVLNGLLQYGFAFHHREALELGCRLLDELRAALEADRFLEGANPRPAGQRAQGPFMIALGAYADLLETLQQLHGPGAPAFAAGARALIEDGRANLEYILANHYRPADHAFWEANQDGEPLEDAEGRVVTDPGHTIEFTGFAARFSRFLEPEAGEKLRATARNIFLWACRHGFHAERDLIYKNIERDSGRPIANETVQDISQVVSAQVLAAYFGGKAQTVRLATFPWWVPMELLAAGGILRHGDASVEVDSHLLRAARGLFRYYQSPRIEGLCYQNIGDGFFEWVDIPPATATLDLMHSHRSLRVFLREVGATQGGGEAPTDTP